MRDIAIVAFGQTENKRTERLLNEAEMIAPVVGKLLKDIGLKRTDMTRELVGFVLPARLH